jgi:hypothetical protein
VDPIMQPAPSTFCVTFTLRHVTERTNAVTTLDRTFVNTIVAADAATARILGEQVGRSAASPDWVFDPAEVIVAALDADHVAALNPLIGAVEEEILQHQHTQRVLSAIVAKYGPIALTQAEYDQAIPGDVAQVIGGGTGDLSWWVLPHQFCVPFAVGRLPELPANGVVSAADLHQHPGREVLVSSSEDPTVHVPASRWSWRTIIDVRDHPDGPAWKLLLTDQGAQAIITAGAYVVRDPRPVPARRQAAGELDG